MYQVQAEDRLDQLPLPLSRMVFEEAFSSLLWQSSHFPWPNQIQTVRDLAREVGLPCDQVCDRLKQVIHLAQNCKIETIDQFNSLDLVTAQFRFLNVQQISQDLPQQILVTEIDFPVEFAKWTEEKAIIVVIADHESQALSACLYLREQGLAQVFYLDERLDPADLVNRMKRTSTSKENHKIFS